MKKHYLFSSAICLLAMTGTSASAQQVDTSKPLPLKVEYFKTTDNGSTWTKEREETYTRDKAGNILTESGVQYDPEVKYSYIYNYDERGNMIERITYIGDIPNERFIQSYDDPILKDFRTSNSTYDYDKDKGDWCDTPCDETTYSITRNTDGNITNVKYALLMDNGNYTYQWDMTTSYNPETKQISQVVQKNKGYSYYKLGVAKKWYKTNGQLYDLGRAFSTSISLDEDEDNQLAEGTLYFMDSKTDAWTRKDEIIVDYKSDGSYIKTIVSSDGTLTTISKSVDEDKEWYLEDSFKDKNSDNAYTLDEMTSETEIIIKNINGRRCQTLLQQSMYNDNGDKEVYSTAWAYNEYGDNTYSLYRYSQDNGETWEIRQATSHTLEYDNNTGAKLSDTYEEYNKDAKQYEKKSKMVFSNFVDYSTPIVATPTDAEDISRVYNMQGVCLGDNLDGLPAGMYIVKQGVKTKKVVKKN